MALPPITRVSTAPDGAQLTDDSGIASLGVDNSGDLIVFNTRAPAVGDLFGIEFPSVSQPAVVKNMATGRLTLADGGHLTRDGQAAVLPEISDDGTAALYAVANAGVVFARDIPASASDQATRTADGTAVPIEFLNAGQAAISGDGRSVVYSAELDDDDAFGDRAVYHYDRDTGAVTRADTGGDGRADHDKLSQEPEVSGDGRYVVFATWTDTLSARDGNGEAFDIPLFDAPNAGTADIYRKDIVTGETVLVSLRGDGSQFSKSSFDPDVSDDGRFVAFENTADEASHFRILWRDLETGETRVASAASDGTASDGGTLNDPLRPGSGDSVDPAISGDGRFVLFWSLSDLLAADDEPEAYDLFVKDMQTGELARVGHDAAPEEGRTAAHGPADLAGDGEWIVFASDADDLIADDTNDATDVFRVRNPLFDGQTSDSPTPQEQIGNIYTGYFDRAPDPAGLAYWVDQLKQGMSLAAIAESFSVQPETTGLYPYLANDGAGDPTNFVTQVYNNLFERDPGTAGLDFWVGELQGGKPVGQAIIDIVSGATGDDAEVVANKTQVGLYYAQQVQARAEAWTSETDIGPARGVLDGVAAARSSLETGLEAVDGVVDLVGSANAIRAEADAIG